MALTIATFNCRYLTRAAKQAEAVHLARSKNIDIVVLQETYMYRLTPIKHFDSDFGTRSFWSYGSAGSSGVAVVLMPRFKGSVLRHGRVWEGRAISVALDNGIRIVNIYAPSHETGQGTFFSNLDSLLVGTSKVILVGDFNCVLFLNDRRSHRGNFRKCRRDRAGAQALEQLVEEVGLVDAWQALRSGQSCMTWSGRRLESRIDRFYVS